MARSAGSIVGYSSAGGREMRKTGDLKRKMMKATPRMEGTLVGFR